MAKISAWMALLAASHFEFGTLGPLLAAVALGVGAWRRLQAMSGGLRLMCGAWGVTFGLAWYAPFYQFS